MTTGGAATRIFRILLPISGQICVSDLRYPSCKSLVTSCSTVVTQLFTEIARFAQCGGNPAVLVCVSGLQGVPMSLKLRGTNPAMGPNGYGGTTCELKLRVYRSYWRRLY